MKINLQKAAIAGIAGTVLFDLVGFALTGKFWDIPALLGAKLMSDLWERRRVLGIALVVLAAADGLSGALYTNLFLPTPNWGLYIRAEAENAVMAICHHDGFGRVVRVEGRRYWEGI